MQLCRNPCSKHKIEIKSQKSCANETIAKQTKHIVFWNFKSPNLRLYPKHKTFEIIFTLKLIHK